MRKVLLILGIVLTFSGMGYSWGFFGHKVIQQLAIYALPPAMQPFYYRHMMLLVDTSVRPDERRQSDAAEAPRHFIDIDAFGPQAVQQMPQAWKPAAAKYSVDTLNKYGVVPWYVLKMKENLTRAFYRKDTDSILYYSADLAHYIQDAHVPLHTTVNHDGHLSGQTGLHSLWESKLPEQHLSTYNLRHAKASYLANPEQEIWKVIRASHKLVPELLAMEKKVSKDFTPDTKFIEVMRNGQKRLTYSDAFATAYHQALGNMVQDRMREAATQTASFWYTCWVDGGKPDLDQMLLTPRTKEEQKQMKQEQLAWKKGTLQEKDLLLTKIRISLMNVVDWVKEPFA
ncbi:zinc dependent phospholipase C family protein [Rufibacter soli]